MIANSYSFTIQSQICLTQSNNQYEINIDSGIPIDDMTHISP